MPLRLKSLELQGYKTFASRTLFEFSGGITAIVGPNGSGKSNIADALRWVLGEQSFGLLRAKKTEDMIFAGSESRTRAGMASASILFDNNENWLPVDFSEVAMGRRAYRDGRNDYLLNGQHVRLREINELLAQSGLSERTYTILGQGLVDASLALKADERRRLFEEAAGVGLYRTRREETLRRLETTKRNLERVLDIMSEVEPRLRSLDRQARRAREYARLQNDLRLVLLDWYGYHWHKAQQELNESREILRQQEERQNKARESFQSLQSEYVSFRKRILELRAQLSDWHRELSEFHGQRETVSRELAILDERQRSLQNSRQSVSMERDRIEQEIKASRERLKQAQNEVTRVKDEFEEANTHLTSAQKSLEALQANYQESAIKLDKTRALVIELNTRRAEAQARLDDLTSRRELQDERLETITKTIQIAQEEYDKADLAYHSSQSELEEIYQKIKKSDKDLARKQDQVELIEGKVRAKNEAISEGIAAYSRLSAQLEVLDQAEQSLSGYAEGARYLLETEHSPRLKGTRGVLSASLEVPAELEIAVAAALGDQLDAVILAEKNLDEALKLLESDDAGRTALLALDRFGKITAIKAPQDPDCLGVAATLVNYPDELREGVNTLLGQTLIVRDRGAAKRLIEGQPGEVKVVTLQGEVFRGDGLVVAGKSSHGTILSRPRQRRELRESLATLGNKQKTLEKEVLALASDLQIKQEQLSQSEKTHSDLGASLVEKQATEREASVALDSALRQLEWQQSQLKELRAEESRVEAKQQNYTKTQAEIETKANQIEEELRLLTNQFAEISLEESQEQVSYWKTRVAVAEQTLNDAKTREEERLISLEGSLEKSDNLDLRSNELQKQLTDVEEERKILKAREENLQTEISNLRELIKPADVELSSAEKHESSLQSNEGESQRVMTAADRQFNQVQVEVIRRQEALETLRSRIQDDFGLVMFEYAQDVVGPMPLPLDGMVEQLPVIKELPDGLDAQLSQQRAQLRRMGPVNPEAEKEYEKESQRFEFLKTQVEDLRKAEADLRQVISELDNLTRQEFSKTFDAVDKEFRQIFVRLFGGGSARLALTDPDNLVDTGIEIEARLPGRREQGLALLSGGERSLTAIALVFALLKVSPTPVCVMDEVDAMLDEANVGRFRELLFELSKETQFIIITHNRNTVQVADVIYGVTMGRDSVSQIISLRLDEVTEEYIGS
jgi:chromosome segregation protein